MAGPISFTPQQLGSAHHIMLRYSPADEAIQTVDQLTQKIQYTVQSTGVVANESPGAELGRQPSNIDPRIAQYARRPEVSGGLAAQRLALAATQPAGSDLPTVLDEQIARNIEHHLQSTFKYTLDLTDTERIAGQDPIVAFLYDFKRGHCEYFAGAMTLLCQSLGMDARLVVGFKCDEYNRFGHYYQVKQSQAHAWVEVLTADGWKTFDPTSGQEASPATASLWQNTKHFFNFLQYKWANAVIAYDAENRDNIIETFNNRITNTAINSSVAVEPIARTCIGHRPRLCSPRGLSARLILLLSPGDHGGIGRLVPQNAGNCTAAPSRIGNRVPPRLQTARASSANSVSTTTC